MPKVPITIKAQSSSLSVTFSDFPSRSIKDSKTLSFLCSLCLPYNPKASLESYRIRGGQVIEPRIPESEMDTDTNPLGSAWIR